MAQPLHCDYAGCPLLAEWITSRIENGDTLAWCDEHYLFLCRSVVAQADQVPEPAPETEPQPEPAGAAAGAEPFTALSEGPGPVTATEPGWSEDVTPEPDNGSGPQPQVIEGHAPLAAEDAPSSPQEGPGASQAAEVASAPAHVVKRGTAPSRRAYEARQRRKATQAAGQAAEGEDHNDGH